MAKIIAIIATTLLKIFIHKRNFSAALVPDS